MQRKLKSSLSNFHQKLSSDKSVVNQKYPYLEVPIVRSNPMMILVFPGMAALSTTATFHQVCSRPQERKASANMFQVKSE